MTLMCVISHWGGTIMQNAEHRFAAIIARLSCIQNLRLWWAMYVAS